MFQVLPLSADRFSHLYGLSEGALAAQGIHVHVADAKPGFPCRVTLQYAEIGDRCLLLNYEHQPADTPYQARHAIYVRDGARTADLAVDELPEVFRIAPMLSVRAFSADGLIVTAKLVEGAKSASLFNELLDMEGVAYLHAHFAAYGCYAARIERSRNLG